MNLEVTSLRQHDALGFTWDSMFQVTTRALNQCGDVTPGFSLEVMPSHWHNVSLLEVASPGLVTLIWVFYHCVDNWQFTVVDTSSELDGIAVEGNCNFSQAFD